MFLPVFASPGIAFEIVSGLLQQMLRPVLVFDEGHQKERRVQVNIIPQELGVQDVVVKNSLAAAVPDLGI